MFLAGKYSRHPYASLTYYILRHTKYPWEGFSSHIISRSEHTLIRALFARTLLVLSRIWDERSLVTVEKYRALRFFHSGFGGGWSSDTDTPVMTSKSHTYGVVSRETRKHSPRIAFFFRTLRIR